ncbi:accessory factor UbiK family protein [Chitinivorax sp. PXF-14]|uniref:accessory factor UbiK family protein n=1 Tax=Chitinivorax sp. PXF-14 TaxID=3230488 RepID=UPI003466F117
MLRQKIMEDISAKISETLASSPAKDMEKNVKAMLGAAFTRLDLVTREEFDIQQEVLKRTREKLSQLEARIAELEQKLPPSDAA